MRIVRIQATRTNLSPLIDEVATGEEIIITRAGRPVARLAPLGARSERPKRVLGILAGQIRVSEDFDAPLPEDLLDAFEGH